MEQEPQREVNISLAEFFKTWLRVSWLSFGGPAGQISVMHRIIVDEKKWVSDERFLHALNFCMLIPGPEAQQTATYLGWLTRGCFGGIVAGTLFILPGMLSILLLSLLYVQFGNTTFVNALLFGLKAAVIAVVIEAVIRLGRRVLKNPVMVVIASLSFVMLFFVGVPFPVIILVAAAIGFFGQRWKPAWFHVLKPASARSDSAQERMLECQYPNKTRNTLLTALVFLALWLVPLYAIFRVAGAESVYFQEASFFSKAAMVTFGGAYSVLAYVAQQAVERFQWLTAAEMLDGLGMAETTPGPLIMVVQFVGFLAAYRNPGSLEPWVAGVIGSLVTTWVTFAPCFVWVFAGAPYIERLRRNQALVAALSAVTAAVVGVVLNLSLWFAMHTLFWKVQRVQLMGLDFELPQWSSLNIGAAIVSAVACWLLFRVKWPMPWVLALCALLGCGIHVCVSCM